MMLVSDSRCALLPDYLELVCRVNVAAFRALTFDVSSLVPSRSICTSNGELAGGKDDSTFRTHAEPP